MTSQQQHLIELIRERKVEAALTFAQTHLAERGEENETMLGELEKSLALLAFDNPEASPFGELLHPSHRQKVGVSGAQRRTCYVYVCFELLKIFSKHFFCTVLYVLRFTVHVSVISC